MRRQTPFRVQTIEEARRLATLSGVGIYTRDFGEAKLDY